jgi:hypothetical protein
MIDLVFEHFRRTTESALQMQRDFLRHWSQQWLSGPLITASQSTAWYQSLQRRWLELTISVLHRNRQALDAAYRSGIELFEQLSRLTGASSAEETREIMEGFWRKLFDIFRVQSEAQLRDLREWSEKSLDMVNTARGAHVNGNGHMT